ncbi:hypothetical protein C1646_757179 [Rhizophagus diaphanus]|nr:hypothetical protein C1646_757179 [Rhizophagus diaphanus] [Rhizophagus sp. MUCL 43196]
MFDAKFELKDIKRRYNWQAVKILDEKERAEAEFTIIKNYIVQYRGHFAKIIKMNKVKYILIYFNNEKDLLIAVYSSTMDEDLGKGLQMKGKDEIIGKDSNFTKRRYRNSTKENAQPEDEQFEDALTSPKLNAVSIVLRT